ncbi:hypothetical protein [Halorubrum aethiopicum]|uniref:hypothetical protein n=1 Tax=Halorubrum aethiopicum TaxID=1758255 RepID=UPI0008335D69|nr:hypothetical protein [Halorubrum aethiopicum]
MTIDYEATDVTDVSAADATVTWGGTAQTVSNVEVVDDTTLTLTLDTAYTLDGATSETADVELDGVINPKNTGDYSVDVTLTDTSTSTDLGPASGTFTVTQGDTASVTSASTLSEDATVTYEADDSMGDVLELEANTDNLELQVRHDGATLETYDSNSDAFTVVTAAGDSTPGTYEFNVTQGAYSGVGVDYNDTANVTFAVENLDATDAPANMFTVTLDNQADRSQIHISAAEIDSPNVLDVTTETDEPWLAEYRDVENETSYEVSATRGINGANSTVTVFASDDGVSEEIDAATEDAEDGDIIHGLALAHDEGVALISYNERADHLSDGDSYAVYDSSTDQIEFTTGDEYENADSVDVTFATTPATDLEDVEVSSVASAYEGSELGIRSLSSDLGWFDAFRVADSPFSWEIPSLSWGPFGDDDSDEDNAFVLGQAGV